MFEVNCNGEISFRPKIKPATHDYKSDALSTELITWATKMIKHGKFKSIQICKFDTLLRYRAQCKFIIL